MGIDVVTHSLLCLSTGNPAFEAHRNGTLIYIYETVLISVYGERHNEIAA